MDFQVYDIAIIPLIVAVVGIISMMGVPAKYLPIVALVLGVLVGVFYIAPGDLPKGIISGIVAGVAAIGTHSGVKNTVQSRPDTTSGEDI